ncbi:MAG: hypothetical protein GJU76_10495 [Gallionella sp.]|nr:hypothetical protein [Gallionella sp.]
METNKATATNTPTSEYDNLHLAMRTRRTFCKFDVSNHNVNPKIFAHFPKK